MCPREIFWLESLRQNLDRDPPILNQLPFTLRSGPQPASGWTHSRIAPSPQPTSYWTIHRFARVINPLLIGPVDNLGPVLNQLLSELDGCWQRRSGSQPTSWWGLLTNSFRFSKTSGCARWPLQSGHQPTSDWPVDRFVPVLNQLLIEPAPSVNYYCLQCPNSSTNIDYLNILWSRLPETIYRFLTSHQLPRQYRVYLQKYDRFTKCGRTWKDTVKMFEMRTEEHILNNRRVVVWSRFLKREKHNAFWNGRTISNNWPNFREFS